VTVPAAELLLATDFDGTVAAIHADPAAPHLDPGFAGFLRSCADREGVIVAIISGRDLDDLGNRVRGVPAYLAGSHGLEIASPDGARLRQTPALSAELPGAVEQIALASGLRIERKRHGIALHWRDQPAVDDLHPALAAFRAWAADHRLQLIAGRSVLEARLAGGGKAEALRFLAGITGARRILYAGDDLTDLPALRFAAARGRAFFVASSEREPPSIAAVAGNREELLRMFADEIARLGTAGPTLAG
jgi:trehalose-phosphatase